MAAGGTAAVLLDRWAGVDRRTLDREVPGIRLLGGVHRLVLSRRAPELALFYPSVGGTADPRGIGPALGRVLVEHGADLRGGLGQAPQTNEVGRAGPLLGGLMAVAAHTGGLPVRLVEMGASAGLNLRADHLPVGPGRVVDTPLPDVGAAAPPVIDRWGGDVAPVDPTTDDGRLLLSSYVWPDDLVRFARLRIALDVARRVPAPVLRVGAGELVARLQLRPGTVTVLWHSVMWQYVAERERSVVRSHLARLGAEATPEAPFAHLRFEPQPAGAGRAVFLVRLTTWPDGGDVVLGHAPPHGVPVVWDGCHG